MTQASFMKVYSNLPDDVRKEVIVVIEGKPYSWDAALVEIVNETELAKKILEKLLYMELI